MSKLTARLGVFPFLLIGIGLFVIGIITLNYIVNSWYPFDTERIDLVRAVAQGEGEAANILEAANTDIVLVFLATILMTVTGLVLPLAYVVNKRFGLGARPGHGPLTMLQFFVTLRQAVWVGVWVSFCTWLQMNRAFSIAVAMLAAVVLILFELLLQVRTRTATTTPAGIQSE